jgi:hypothetical protein
MLWAVLLVCYTSLRLGGGVAPASSLRDVPGLLVSLERQILLLSCVGALFYVWQTRKIHTALFHGVLVAVVFIDFYTAHKPYRFLTDQTLISRRPEALDLIKDQDSYRLFYLSAPLPLHPVAALFAGAKSPSDQGIFALETLRPNTGRIWGVNYLQDIDALSRRSHSLFLEVANGLARSDLIRLLGRMNAKYIFTLEELAVDGVTPLAHLPKHPSWLYRIEQVTPRAYVVPQAMQEKDPKRAITRLAEREFNPSQLVLLEEPVPLPIAGDFSGAVTILSYRALQISLAAVLDKPGILVLADAFAPGWNAYVNGTRTRILRGNYFFRAVALPAGRHQVLFRYEPDSFRYGIVVTVLSLGLLVGILMSRLTLFHGSLNRPHGIANDDATGRG